MMNRQYFVVVMWLFIVHLLKKFYKIKFLCLCGFSIMGYLLLLTYTKLSFLLNFYLCYKFTILIYLSYCTYKLKIERMYALDGKCYDMSTGLFLCVEEAITFMIYFAPRLFLSRYFKLLLQIIYIQLYTP